jgi:hypothetical protein
MLMLTRISKRLSHSYDEIKRNIEIKVEKMIPHLFFYSKSYMRLLTHLTFER